MYVILLRFSSNKARAADHMAGHQEWISAGVDEGVFHLVGSIRPDLGGAVIASGVSPEDLQARVDADPFVVHDVVTAEIIDIAPNLTDSHMSFLTH
ncbi:YciI family protein [Nocardioides limicola]|uniref:YciI family protein n=1 Tax=Nocardioides limicola TaxID=2803368 RepID=UPI00193C3694|nr:hypothetical protein [Nocardioides sp. DJM-14]